jgi:TRAP-type mannitol/chloroaromatic compound transport system permease small subunit
MERKYKQDSVTAGKRLSIDKIGTFVFLLPFFGLLENCSPTAGKRTAQGEGRSKEGVHHSPLINIIIVIDFFFFCIVQQTTTITNKNNNVLTHHCSVGFVRFHCSFALVGCSEINLYWYRSGGQRK